MASSGSYSTNRGRIPGFRTTSLRPRTRSVVPKTGVTSDPEYVVGIAATNQRGSPAAVPPAKRATAAFAVPIGLPPPRPTSTSAFRECASFATCSAVSTGTCGRVPENIPTMSGPSALRTVCPTRPNARLEPVTTYACVRPSRPSWGASSSTHPGASTINVSPSWRGTRGSSAFEVRARIPRGGASRNGSRDRVRLGRICEPPLDNRSLSNGQVLRGEGLHRVHRVSPPGGRSDGHRRKPGGDSQVAGHSRMDLAEVVVRSGGQGARIEFEHGTWREEFPRSHVGQCPGRGEGRT